jgi:hypothetical protein
MKSDDQIQKRGAEGNEGNNLFKKHSKQKRQDMRKHTKVLL